MPRVARVMVVAAALFASPGMAQTGILGPDADACIGRGEPAIEVTVTGLKDRTGELKLELYPATEADFLKDDRDLRAEGKLFHRIWAPIPADGPVTLCIRVPRPGTYGLFFTHNRDGKNKFNVWVDGAGVSSNRQLGRAKPRLEQAAVTVGRTVTRVSIRAQYLRGVIPSFGFVGK